MNYLPMGKIPLWHAERRPDDIAIVQGLEQVSWAGLARNAARRARGLLRAGVRPDDVVAMVLPNGNAFVESIFAIWMAGATPMPLSHKLTPAEVSALLDLARPACVIGAGELQGTLPPEWDAQGEDDTPLSIKPASCWKIMASGGSTGTPKLIRAERPAVADPAVYELFPWDIHQGRLGYSGGRMLNPGPLCHNGPFVHAFMNLLAGSQLVNMAQFDPETWLALVERHAITFGYLVPTMMNRIMQLPAQTRDRYDLSSLQGIVHTAAPCPPWLKEAWIDWLGPERVWETYGSTEAVASTVIDGQSWRDHPGSVGQFFSGRGKVLDCEGQPVPFGTMGELWVQASAAGDPVFSYVGSTPRERDGWYSFGDLAAMDAEGHVYIADRRHDLIIRGGTNIYPAELEAALEGHEAIAEAVVIGLPDDDMGARVHAILRTKSGTPIDEDSLFAFLRSRLASYKQPQSIEFVTDALRDNAGKLRRSEFRAQRLPRTG